MDNNKKIQTSPRRLYSYSEKRNKNKKNKALTADKKNHLLIKTDNIRNSEKKDKNDGMLIKLQNGTIIGKLYKKTNETEWATTNRAIKEKNPSNYEIKQILKRYKFNQGKLRFGLDNNYINLLTELLYSKKKEDLNYSKERLKLYNLRINFGKKNKKAFRNIVSGNFAFNNSDNNTIINDHFRQKLAISSIATPHSNKNNRNIIKNDMKGNIYFKTYFKNHTITDNNINLCKINVNNNSKSINVLNKTMNKNNKKMEKKLKNMYNCEGNNNINNQVSLINSLYRKNKNFCNNIKSLKYNSSKKENEINNIYLNVYNDPSFLRNNNNLNDYSQEKIKFNNKNDGLKNIDETIIEPNKSLKYLNKSNSSSNSKDLKNKDSIINASKLKNTSYKNERDIYFEKENEEDEFLANGDKDKYEDYLKNKFGFFEDIQDKKTQYIYEIKKRNYKIFNNKNIEMKDDHKPVLNYLNKLSRTKKNEKENVPRRYSIHDIFKERYSKATLNRMKLNHHSKNIMKQLKIAYK